MKNVTWISNLKLRASWGQTGNQEISNIARYTLYVSNYGEANFGGQSYGTSLWRYMIGDTVMFTSKNPYKFVITGRTKHFINAFGEELIVDNAEKGLREACRQTQAVVSEYTAAPVFMDEAGKCRHQWLIEFATPPADLNSFADILDTALQQVNSDYEAKRFKDITLQRLEIVPARNGLFNEWFKQAGRLGGQHKVPRLCNDRKIIEQLLALNA